MSEWTEERNEAAKARCKSLRDGPHVMLRETKCITLVNEHAVDFAEVIYNDLPDALAEIERLQREVTN